MGRNSKKQFRRNERTYRGHQNLDKFLSDKKLQRKQIAKDGSCLFRAVAEQVFSSQSCHQKVRMQCVEYIQAHQDDFKEFITTSMPEYLDQLKNELWGGELELVVLSRLYERSIIIYNEANGVVHEQVFQATEDQASTPKYSPIMLAFSGGNHYDSVYKTQHLKNTAFCQGIVYQTLFLGVLKDTMPPYCKQRLASLQDSDVEQIRLHKESSHPYDRPFVERPVHLLSTHYMVEEIEAMAANIYRNTAMDVHQREKASNERRDRRVAASIQFQRGDAIIFKVGDKEMEGEIANLYVSPGCHLVFMYKSGETWEIPAKDIALKQSHLNSGRRFTSGQSRSRNQQQQFSGQTSGQKGQQQSESSKAADTPTATKETPSSKKSGAQGAKSKEGRKGSTTSAQQGSQNPPSKGVPAGAVPLQAEKTAAPPPRTPTSDQKQAAPSGSSVSPPGGAGVESSTAATATGQRRVAPSLSRNIQHAQVRSGHSVKATSHSAKVTKRTDAGSLDSDDPSSTSDDETSPYGEHHHPHSRRRPHHRHQASRANNITTDSLPAYYDEDDWSIGEQEAVADALQKQQSHTGGKERKTIPVVEGKLHVGRGGLEYPDRSVKQQQQQRRERATQKAVSGQTVKTGGGSAKVGEIKTATSPQSGSDPSKICSGSRQTGTTAPTTKGEPARTSPAGKQSQQRSAQQSKVVMQVPAPAGLLQQQSPIQGLIDGPNSERDGRESPPYLDRMIPRDPSSQPQDAWPLFEEDPATHPTANLPPSIEAMMLNITSRQQHRAPPPSSPPAGSGIVVPSPASNINTTHSGNPPLPEHGTGIIPVVPPLPRAHAQQQPTPPQSPITDQLQTGGAGKLPPLPTMFPPRVPISPPPSTTTTAAALPTMFHPLMQAGGRFVPPMTTAAAMQQFFAVSSGQDMLYNQAHHTRPSAVAPPLPPPLELASGAGGSGNDSGSGDSSTGAGIPPSLVSPLQPLSIKKSSPRGEHTATAMSPLTVTAYTQTFFPRLTSTHVQTDVKEFHEKGTQFNPRVKKAGTQTDHHFVAAREIGPPKLENDSQVAKVNFAIEYSIKCLNVYLQYIDDDETSAELLQMLENLKEQQLEEKAMPQLTALNSSQQDFLVSLARNRLQQFPINAHPVGEGPTGMSFYQPQPMKEATPPQVGDDVTLQQAAASLPALNPPHGIPPDALASSSSTSDLPTLAPDDEKSSETNVDVTPQQEIQPPTAAAPPYPVPPQLMMHPQRYMMPLPMFYGFYPPSFPGVPGLPGVPGMVRSPYGHHMIPPMHQQQQQQPPPPPGQTEQTAQSLESLEEAASTTSTSTTKLSPPLPRPSGIIPNQLPTSIPELEGSSATAVDHQSVQLPVVDSAQALHGAAFQVEDGITDDSEGLPPLAMNPSVENEGEGLQPTEPISTILEDQLEGQKEDDGQQEMAFVPSTTTTSEAYVTTDIVQHPVEQPIGDYQMQSEETVPSTVESDVNISNPGLPCRGSSGGNAKETEAGSSASGEDPKENEQKADTKRQKSKSSRTKQQQEQQQQQQQQQSAPENTSSKQQSKTNGATYPRQQQNYQRMGNTGAYNGNNKSTGYNRGRYTYGNQRQQQYNNRRYNNGGRMYYTRYNSGGGNSGRYQQNRTQYPQGDQQQDGGSSGSASNLSSSEQSMSRPHNPSRSKAHTSSSGSSEHGSGKSVTPVPATNAAASTEDQNRNVPQFNNSNNNYSSSGTGKFSPKSFTSFPSSPQNHPSSINGEMATNSNMVVPQTATESAPVTTPKEGDKKVHRWQFKETSSDGQRLEVPDPNLWNWTSGGGVGHRQQGDYTETVEDPFPTMTVGGDDKEFAFKDMDDFDARQMEELFPALKSNIPGLYDTTTSGVHHPPAQCTNRSDAQVYTLAGLGGGYSAVHN